MSLPAPYYDDGAVTLYHGDALELLPELACEAWLGAMVTDPPYGIGYESGYDGDLPRGIAGDQDTGLRDMALAAWLPRPAAVFATWRCTPPAQPRGCLVWEKNAGGMGDLSFPWAPRFELVWVFGEGWSGRRTSSVLRGSTVPTWNSGPAKRLHPHEKPVDLLEQIIGKAPGTHVLDPFAGSGSTLVAAKLAGRKAVGVELEERFCEVAARRLAQGALPFG